MLRVQFTTGGVSESQERSGAGREPKGVIFGAFPHSSRGARRGSREGSRWRKNARKMKSQVT